jgi:hypothetical protein
MRFDLSKILQCKRDFRQRAAARTIGEKLAMLDALRERHLALCPTKAESSLLKERGTHRFSEKERG